MSEMGKRGFFLSRANLKQLLVISLENDSLYKNFKFMGATVFEIVGGPADPPPGKRCGYQKAW